MRHCSSGRLVWDPLLLWMDGWPVGYNAGIVVSSLSVKTGGIGHLLSLFQSFFSAVFLQFSVNHWLNSAQTEKELAIPLLRIIISEVRYKMMQPTSLYKISTPLFLNPKIGWSQNPVVKGYRDPSTPTITQSTS